MTWALVFLSCFRFCEPQYVELYSSKEACNAKIPEQARWSTKTAYCVPVAK